MRFHLERLALARAARVMREGGAGREAMSVEDNAALVALNACTDDALETLLEVGAHFSALARAVT